MMKASARTLIGLSLAVPTRFHASSGNARNIITFASPHRGQFLGEIGDRTIVGAAIGHVRILLESRQRRVVAARDASARYAKMRSPSMTCPTSCFTLHLSGS